VLLDASRVDVVEGDPLQDVLRRIVDGHGQAGHAPDDPEEGVAQAASALATYVHRVLTCRGDTPALDL